MLVQLVVGVPLEMVHGSIRIGIIYMTGVLAGKLLIEDITNLQSPRQFSWSIMNKGNIILLQLIK